MGRGPVGAALVGLLFTALLAVPAAADPIQAIRVDSSGPLLDPDAMYWRKAPEASVPLLAQTMALPMHPEPAVTSLRVKAAHNGQWIGLLLTWDDPSQSDRIVVDEFGDQIAVELPMRYVAEQLPAPMMGNPGARVAILQWRAAFQRDLQQGDPELRDLYPNALVDVYPDEVLRATDARPYSGAVGLDNPISHARRRAVLDQMAEGWGTMTVTPEQHADGRGIWEDGRWRVVITHPLWNGGAHDPDLLPGRPSAVAFAVWEGGNGEVGGRKSWAPWVPLQIAP